MRDEASAAGDADGAQVVAMQFAGGMSIARLVEEEEVDVLVCNVGRD